MLWRGRRAISEYVKRAGPNVNIHSTTPWTVDTVSFGVADMTMFMLTDFSIQYEPGGLPIPTNRQPMLEQAEEQ